MEQKLVRRVCDAWGIPYEVGLALADEMRANITGVPGTAEVYIAAAHKWLQDSINMLDRIDFYVDIEEVVYTSRSH